MANEVEFHTGVADPVGFACRLLRKAYRQKVRVLVGAPAAVLAALDRELWTFDERDFVPHLRVSAATASGLAARTPIWLADGATPPGAPDVLLNLGGPAFDPARFARVIEIVSRAPDDEQAGRARWREYKAQGLEIRHHPAAANEQRG